MDNLFSQRIKGKNLTSIFMRKILATLSKKREFNGWGGKKTIFARLFHLRSILILTFNRYFGRETTVAMNKFTKSTFYLETFRLDAIIFSS